MLGDQILYFLEFFLLFFKIDTKLSFQGDSGPFDKVILYLSKIIVKKWRSCWVVQIDCLNFENEDKWHGAY